MITIPIKYAYLSLSIATLFVWLGLYLVNKDGRSRQLVLSCLFSIAGPIGELFYIPDYWHPPTIWSAPIFQSYISIEDFIFGFAIMGIMSSLPPLAFQLPKPQMAHPLSKRAVFEMIIALGAVAALSLLLWFVPLNSIFATSLAMLIVAIAILTRSRRPLLWRISFVGAFGMVVVMFIIYWLAFLLITDSDAILRSIWTLYGTSLGHRILRVPLPELVWAFCFGSFFSILFSKDRLNASP